MSRLVTLLPLVIALVAACSGDDDGPTRTTNSTTDPTSTSVVGQSTETTAAPESTPTNAPTATAEATATVTASPTPAATATLVATSTPAPTATPEATPPDVQIVQFTTGPANSIGAFMVWGFVQNNGETAAQDVQVVVSLYDGAGAILGSADGRVPSLITAGAQVPFHAYVSDVDRAAVTETRIQTQYQPLDLDSFGGSYYITTFEVPQINWTGSGWAGEITNVGDAGASFVQIFVAGLDANGAVIVAESTYADLDQLNPGTTSPFSISFFDEYPAPTTTIYYVIGQEL